jgi:hypothetical protein
MHILLSYSCDHSCVEKKCILKERFQARRVHTSPSSGHEPDCLSRKAEEEVKHDTTMRSSSHSPAPHMNMVRGSRDVLTEVEKRLSDERPAVMKAPVNVNRSYDLPEQVSAAISTRTEPGLYPPLSHTKCGTFTHPSLLCCSCPWGHRENSPWR